MADKGVFKRCGCTEVVGGKRRELGKKCPKLNSRGHGSWWFQVDAAPIPGTGQTRRRVRRGGFATKTEAETERAKIVGKATTAAHRRVPSDQVTVSEFLDRWIASRGRKPATMASYRGHIVKYLKPHLGRVRVLDLSVTDVRKMFDAIEVVNEEIRANRAEQKPLRRGQSAPPGYETRKAMGAASMQPLRATGRAAWNSELAAELGVTGNPFAAVELDSGKAPQPMLWTTARVAAWQVTGEIPGKVMVWTPVQLGAWLDHAYVEEPRLARLYDLVANTGMRRGEACGLRWPDVDTGAKVLRIAEQLTVVEWKVLAGTPKSEFSQRTIGLSAPMLALIQEQERQQSAEEATWGSAWIDSGRVFTAEGGEALHPDAVSARFRELVESSGLPPISLHGLRHAAATIGLAASGCRSRWFRSCSATRPAASRRTPTPRCWRNCRRPQSRRSRR